MNKVKIIFLLVLTITIFSCHKTTNSIDDSIVFDQTYILSHTFTISNKISSNENNNKIQIWIVKSNDNTLHDINNVPDDIFWKYNNGDPVSSVLILQIYQNN